MFDLSASLLKELTDNGAEMRWRYGPFRNKLRRLTEPPMDHPATAVAAEAAEARA